MNGLQCCGSCSAACLKKLSTTPGARSLSRGSATRNRKRLARWQHKENLNPGGLIRKISTAQQHRNFTSPDAMANISRRSSYARYVAMPTRLVHRCGLLTPERLFRQKIAWVGKDSSKSTDHK